MRSFVSLFIVLGVISSAYATPVTWNLQGVMSNGPMGPTDVYGDGLVEYPVTGSFIYDADTNAYSSINIVTPFRTWTDANLAAPWLQDWQHLKVLDPGTNESLVLSFQSGLTNAGGIVTLRTGDDAVDCFVSECGSVEYGETGPLTWTLENVTTTGGVPWMGSFDWQSCSPSSCYLNINIVSGVAGFPNPIDTISTDSVLGAGCTDPATNSGVTLGPDAAGFTIFCMDFVSPLTVHGGTIDLVTGGTGWAVQGFSEMITGGAVSSPPIGGPYYFAGAVSTSSPAVPVEIDVTSSVVHPHHDGSPSAINGLNDVISVAVFSSSTAVGGSIDFDATTIDTTSVRFGPSEASIAAGSVPDLENDYDADGMDDAYMEFLTGDTGVGCADTEMTIAGETDTGMPFVGADTINADCNAQCHN